MISIEELITNRRAAGILIKNTGTNLYLAIYSYKRANWGIPCGKYDPDYDANMLDTAIREVYEETFFVASKRSLKKQTPFVCVENTCEVTSYFHLINPAFPSNPRNSKEGICAWVPASILLDPKYSAHAKYNQKMFEHFGLPK